MALLACPCSLYLSLLTECTASPVPDSPDKQKVAAEEVGATDDESPLSYIPGQLTSRDEQPLDLAACIAFIENIPADNAIAQRFISAAHLLARGVLINAVFTFIRALDFTWEESAKMTGDILNMSRSTVSRSVSDIDRLMTFWNESGYSVADVKDVADQISDLTKHRIAQALEKKAAEGRGDDPADPNVDA